ENGYYQQELANALFDISVAVTFGSCTGTIALPPTFKEQLRLERTILGVTELVGVIFWNDDQACICFTGTMTKAQLVTDFNYAQVPATQLNGYQEGVLVHQGFYN